MSLDMETFYNTSYNVIVPPKIITYLLTFYIISTNTPHSMRTFSRFLWNILLWDFLIHVLWLGLHPFPMMPLVCFRLDGYLASYFFSESFAHIFSAAYLTCCMNEGIAIFLSFQFRLFTSKYGSWSCSKIYVYAYCIALHMLLSSVFVWLNASWSIPVEHYPEPIEPSERRNLFCYKPRTHEFQYFLLYFAAFLVLALCGITILVVLSFREVNKNRHLAGEKTAQMQASFLRSQVLLSCVPTIFGSVPYIIITSMLHFPDTSHARIIVIICLLIASVYGPIMCTFAMILFKPYRRAVLRILKNATNAVPFSLKTKHSVIAVQKL
ncbi:hypothetical protein QR680_011191 [Steinernema hermaphroditum]|uniref:Uncharacterized protein n=1 Tax=Steinernema hermaphroditum TaxID=289476 RepID=A0AA39ISU4_9BILA|nr:hypothetical protein QR680_011191 [Steinernema hermaphroditum]